MSKAQPTPILNASLPPQFRQIRIELAREHGHPEGERGIAYLIVAPLTSDGLIDPKIWKHHREACRVVRLRPNENEQPGHLVYQPGGTWGFHYDPPANLSDETGYHFSDERFVVGEYVSIKERGNMHTYRVTSVAHL